MSFLAMAHRVTFSIINWSIFGLTKSTPAENAGWQTQVFGGRNGAQVQSNH
jgi:hypothetical protein